MSDPNTDSSLSLVRCGIDEVGRGPLAGPVTAAAAILPASYPEQHLGDSKSFSPARRLRIENELLEGGVAFALGWVGPEEIDRINIHNASLLAMRRAYDSLASSIAPDIVSNLQVFVDGKFCPIGLSNCTAVIGGDRKIPEIMAASILAKNARDAYMVRLASNYPQYGFDAHKGYPTPSHKAALRTHGPTPIHRRSFRGVVDEERSDGCRETR